MRFSPDWQGRIATCEQQAVAAAAAAAAPETVKAEEGNELGGSVSGHDGESRSRMADIERLVEQEVEEQLAAFKARLSKAEAAAAEAGPQVARLAAVEAELGRRAGGATAAAAAAEEQAAAATGQTAELGRDLRETGEQLRAEMRRLDARLTEEVGRLAAAV
eukprot:SAG31_NODE_1646_length_7649_cov_3.317616_2_plen_162_part_00